VGDEVSSEIRLYNMDCMEAMKNMTDKAFDLAIVDPPYGLDINTQKGSVIANKSINPTFNKKNWDKKMPQQEYFDELIRVSMKYVIWGGNYFLDYLGFCKAPVIWNKQNGDSMYADGEMAWTGGVDIPRNLKIFNHQWCGAFKASERGNVNIHPTQKPVALYKWLLKNYAKPGDKILDTHLGSGSSAIACYDMGFDLTGYEIDKDYYDAAVNRLENHKKQLTLF
jgi:site-specific DNA-methyltransferase (adenine-specific)